MSRGSFLYSANIDNVSVRDEVTELFERYSRWGVLRRVRRDSSQNRIPCTKCKKIGTHGVALTTICDHCLGAGYIWDEEWVQYYQWPGVSGARSRAGYKDLEDWGEVPTNLAVIYVRAYVRPDVEDKIISVEFDDNGRPLNPVIYKTMFDVRTIDDYRLDTGRLEYFRLTTMKQTMGYFGQPLDSFEPGPGRKP